MKTKLFFILSYTLFAGCVKVIENSKPSAPVSGSVFSETYITGYIIPESFTLPPYIFLSDGKSGQIVKPGTVIYIWFYGERCSADVNSALFNSIAKRIRDKNWNKYHFNGPVIALGKIITSVSVISDANFDADHPVGTSLNDLVDFHGSTAYHFIQNGYKGNEREYINKKISDLTENDLPFLINWDLSIEFTKLPDVQMNHKITVTITFEDGVVLSATQDIVFSE